MSTRIAWLLAFGIPLLVGCTPPNTPEPPPPPPVAAIEPVSPTPTEPSSPPPMTDPATTISPANPDKQAVQPQPVDVADQIAKLTSEADRDAAAVALASAGKSAVPALLKSLDHADWQVRAAAVFALGKIGSDASEAKSRLQTIAEKDENTSVRDAAAFALDAIDSK